jgi:hypothetical protein
VAPVEYAVAVDEYLGHAALGAASRRVYRISLTGWAWPLVGKPIPAGAERRGAVPPVVPLTLLDDPGTGGRLGQALAERAGRTDTRTVNREVSALRSAAGRVAGGGHRLAGGDQPGPVLAAGRADRGAGVRDRSAGAGGGHRPLARDRAGPDVLPARGGALHHADQAARPGGPRLDPAPAKRRPGSAPSLRYVLGRS